MHARVYEGPGHRVWHEVPDAMVEADTDAVVRVETVEVFERPADTGALEVALFAEHGSDPS